jgi:hypothetical protein
LYTAFVKALNGVQSRSEMKVWNEVHDEGEKKEREEERKTFLSKSVITAVVRDCVR